MFYLEINQFKGSILANNLALEYLPWKYVGFGVGVDVEDGLDRRVFDWAMESSPLAGSIVRLLGSSPPRPYFLNNV